MKFNLILGSLGLCIGSWIRYAGTISRSFSVVMGGQVVIGIFAPIAVISPAHYSDIWFSPKSRVSTTALMSLANALGAAVSTNRYYIFLKRSHSSNFTGICPHVWDNQ